MSEYEEEKDFIGWHWVRRSIHYFHKAVSVYLFWIILHYLSLQLYLYFCTPKTWQEALIAPFIISSPHCKALRWAFNYGGTTTDSMWVVLGAWICTKIIKI
jgi:hypothetical protein